MSEHEQLQQVLDQAVRGRDRLQVLEAGCGSVSRLRCPPGSHLAGIDISERQLAANAMLHEKILGDVQSFRWPRPRFDVIVSWDLLEHLAQPRSAITNLSEALLDGGLLVLALPNLLSLKGLVTKCTPWQVHVWFYRYVIGDRRDPSQWDQFPTYLRRDVAPSRLMRHAGSLGLETIWCCRYEGPVQRHLRGKHPMADRAFAVARAVGTTLTLNAWDPTLSDCLLVLRKTGTNHAGARGRHDA